MLSYTVGPFCVERYSAKAAWVYCPGNDEVRASVSSETLALLSGVWGRLGLEEK